MGFPLQTPRRVTTVATVTFSPNGLKLGAAINCLDSTFLTWNATPVVSFVRSFGVSPGLRPRAENTEVA